MGEFFVNESGVQSQNTAITSYTNTAEQLNTNYVSQSTTHQGGLDGAARFDTLLFTSFTRQAVDAACTTLHSLSTFISNSALAVGSVDRAQSRRFHTEM